jgi:hypothetical protein
MTLSQGPADDRREQSGRNRDASKHSPVTICGREVNFEIGEDIQAYIPQTIEILSSVTDDAIESAADGAVSFAPERIRQSLEAFLSISLALGRVTLPQEKLFELHCAAESAAFLALPEFSRGAKPVEDLAVGYLLAALLADAMGSESGSNLEGQNLRDVFKGHVISQVKGQAFEGSIPDGFEDIVRGKLLDCALSNPSLRQRISELLGDWEMLAISGPEATSNLSDEIFSFGEGAALSAEHRLMEDELEAEERALVPKAVEILSSPENKSNWEESLAAIHEKVHGHPMAQIALSFTEQRIDSFSFSQYVHALVDALGEEGFTQMVFTEDRLVPPSIIASLQRHGDGRGLQTIANLTADYLNLPLNSRVSSLRSYLGITDVSLDQHGTAWVTLIEGLREKVRENQFSAYTVEQHENLKAPVGGRIAWIGGSIVSKFEDTPLIKISVLRSSPTGVGLGAIMHQAVSEAGRRDGFGELMSVGIDQLHINRVYQLTELSSILTPGGGEDYRLASCADIDLWVFVAVDGEIPDGFEDPIDIDANVPLPKLR